MWTWKGLNQWLLKFNEYFHGNRRGNIDIRIFNTFSSNRMNCFRQYHYDIAVTSCHMVTGTVSMQYMLYIFDKITKIPWSLVIHRYISFLKLGMNGITRVGEFSWVRNLLNIDTKDCTLATHQNVDCPDLTSPWDNFNPM